MPAFRFFIRGYDVSEIKGICGFFTVRHAFGWTKDHAARRALKRLDYELASGKWRSIWPVKDTALTIEQSAKANIADLWAEWDAGLAVYFHSQSVKSDDVVVRVTPDIGDDLCPSAEITS